MRTPLTTATAFAALTLSAAAGATTSSPSEMRGYESCLASAHAESTGLVADRFYYLDRSDRDNRYYVNATRWENGERIPVRIACTTTRSGRTLLTASIDEGRYTNRQPSVRIEVAQN